MNRYVNVGGPIFLGLVGAALVWAVADMVPNVNTPMFGYILMVGALLWLVFGLIANRPRTTAMSERTSVQGTGGGYAPGAAPGAPQNQVVEREVRQDEV